jgi:hypothetical protein
MVKPTFYPLLFLHKEESFTRTHIIMYAILCYFTIFGLIACVLWCCNKRQTIVNRKIIQPSCRVTQISNNGYDVKIKHENTRKKPYSSLLTKYSSGISSLFQRYNCTFDSPELEPKYNKRTKMFSFVEKCKFYCANHQDAKVIANELRELLQ